MLVVGYYGNIVTITFRFIDITMPHAPKFHKMENYGAKCVTLSESQSTDPNLMTLKKLTLGLIVSTFVWNVQAADPIEIDFEMQKVDVRHRLFKTRNTWNFLQLDTQTGQVWQLQYSVKDDANRLKIPIVKEPLVQNGKVGRFTLYPTKNQFNFILLDQDIGKAWQVQWTIDGSVGYWSIDIDTPKLEWKK